MSLPYQGNKSAIAKDLLVFLKQSFLGIDNFYDLFGGGGTISKEATKHYTSVHYNEILTHIYYAVKSLCDGSYESILLKSEWISREEFFKIRDSEPTTEIEFARKGLVLTCWSFGNNQRDYIYGKNCVDEKLKYHNLCFETTNTDLDKLDYYQRKLYLKKNSNFRIDLQSLVSLESLERLESLELTNLSYEQVQIKPNSLIYCDIPYNSKTSKGSYNCDYDNFHSNFYEWALNNPNPVVFSEYEQNVPTEFKIIWKKNKRNLICATDNKIKSVEVLAWNGKGNFINRELFS